MSRIGKFTETGSRLVVSHSWGGMGVTANRYRVSLCSHENVLKLIVVMEAQSCEHTKNHRIVHFKWVNCVVCELYLNKTVNKKKTRTCILNIFQDSDFHNSQLTVHQLAHTFEGLW